MVQSKECKRQDKIYLSVVEHEETKAELGNTFIVYPSLLRLEFEQIPTIPRYDFTSPLTTRAADRTYDDIHLLHSVSHDNSYTITSFLMLGQKIISDEVPLGASIEGIWGILIHSEILGVARTHFLMLRIPIEDLLPF